MENINGTNYARNIVEIGLENLQNPFNFSPKVAEEIKSKVFLEDTFKKCTYVLSKGSMISFCSKNQKYL